MQKLLFIILLLSDLTCRSQDQVLQNDYCYVDSISTLYKGYSLRNREVLTHLLVNDVKSDEEKFRVIFRFIADNVKYDLDHYMSSKRLEHKYGSRSRHYKHWVSNQQSKSIRRLINKRVAVCGGYAALLKEMCDIAGLNCVVITGYTKSREKDGKVSLDHAWNAVELNNKWYLCDVTWASCYLDPVRMKIHQSFNENYYLTDPALFATQHYPKDPSWLLLYPRPTFAQFVNAPYASPGILTNKINRYYPEKAIVKLKKSDPFQFSFTSNQSVLAPRVSLNVSGSRNDEFITPALELGETGEYCINYSFNKRGKFNVVVYVNRYETLRYIVYVK